MRRAERLLLGLGVALLLATALRMPAAWESGNALNHVSGAWMTLADDLARGTFYRPLDDGGARYGGTRFFPLAFAAHAGLLRAGAGLLPAGFAVAAAAAALLVLGVALLLRRLGLGPLPALAFAALALAGFATQHGLSSIRGDLLPVALSALALAALAPAPTARRTAAAAVLLALAFSAKPTALTAAAAAVGWLLARRELRAAAGLAAAVAALSGAAVLATDALSGGRFLAILRACAGGGASVEHAVRAPLRLSEYLAIADPSGLVLVLCAGVTLAAAAPALARAPGAARASPVLLPALWLVAAAAGAVAVFASPGTGANHLVELEVAAAVTLAAAVASGGRAASIARLAAPVAAVAGLALVLSTWHRDTRVSRLAEARALAEALPSGPILSEDPLVPLVAGSSPLLLDPFMVRLASERDPRLARRLARSIREGAYAGVVLLVDLDAPEADRWYDGRNLGLPLVAELRRRYRHARAIGRYHLYLPVSRDADGPRITAAKDDARVAPGPTPR